MKTIIAGMRNFLNYGTVCNAVDACGWTPTEIVSGKVPGVNSLGERWAKEHGVAVKEFPADWARFGERAGSIRNGQMAAYADALVAVWDGKSKGTGDIIRQAQARGLRVYVHHVAPDFAVALLDKRRQTPPQRAARPA